MGDVIGLTGEVAACAGQPNEEVIKLLEDVLEQARAGNVQHIAMVYLDQNGTPSDAYAPGGASYELIPLVGGLEICKATLVQQMLIAEPV